MFTLRNTERKHERIRAYFLHAASLGSGVLSDKNTLEAHFQNALLPEDELIEDAAVRTLEARSGGADIEITKLYARFQSLRNLQHNTPPTPGARGNMDTIQNRFTPDTASLSGLQSACRELIETGWSGQELTDMVTELNAAYNKIPGLKEIKEAYMALDIAINRFNNVADRHEHITVLSVPEVEKFNQELETVSGKNIENFSAEMGNISETVLEEKLSEIKTKPEYRTLHDQGGFDRKFLSYFSQRLLRKASRNLEITKETQFKDRRAEFEGLMNQSRKAVQEYILTLDPTNPDELERLHQVFVTNRRYFELTGRNDARHLDWDTEMSRRVRAILDRYYGEMIRGYERGAVISRIPGRSTPARRAEDLVQAVLDQSTAENRLYYGSENPMRQPEELTAGQSAVKLLGKSGGVLKGFFESPTTKKWVQGFMGATKKAVETTVGFAGKVVGKSASIVGDTVLAKTTGFINTKMGSVDSWAWKKHEAGLLNTLGWMAKLPARPVTKLGKLLTWTTDGVIGKGVGNIAVSKGVNAILTTGKNAYEKTNEIIAKLPDEEVQDAFSGLGWLVRKSGEWTGKSVEWMGQYGLDRAKANEMRSILASLRSGLDESGRAGMQASQFRSVMGRNWGAGTPHIDMPVPEARTNTPAPAPAAPAPTPATPPGAPTSVNTSTRMTKAQVRQAIVALRKKGMRVQAFLDALLALFQANPKITLLRKAYDAALIRKNEKGANIDTVFHAALAVANP